MIVIVAHGNIGLVGSLAVTALFLLGPSIIQTLMQRETWHHERLSTAHLEAHLHPYLATLFLRVLAPIGLVALIAIALTNERVRRFLRLGTLENDDDQEAHAQTQTSRSSTAIAAEIRKLPLIEYHTRSDLEKLSLKELVAYRNEARDKGYKAITTSRGKKKSEILQSREEVVQEMAGLVDGSDGEDVCSICFAQYESNDILRILPKCGHVFHAECVDRWFLRGRPSCPMCKAKF